MKVILKSGCLKFRGRTRTTHTVVRYMQSNGLYGIYIQGEIINRDIFSEYYRKLSFSRKDRIGRVDNAEWTDSD